MSRKKKPQVQIAHQAKPEKQSIRTRADAIDYLIKAVRSDAWQNPTTGFGTAGYDPLAKTSFHSFGRIDKRQLEDLYQDDWVSGKIIDAPAEDMTRIDPEFTYDEDTHTNDQRQDDLKIKEPETIELAQAVEDIEERLKNDLKWMPRFFEMLKWSRLYGGALMVFFFDDPDEISDPLNPKAVRGINRIEIVHSGYIYPVTWYPPDDPDQPRQVEHYNIQLIGQKHVETVIVHESRVIRMDGREIPLNKRMENNGWGDSILQRVYTAVRQHQVSSASAATTMEEFVIKLLKVENLVELVAENEDDTIIKRIMLAASNMTTHKIALCSKDEELSKQGTPVSGLAELWDRFSEIIAAAADIPRSRFFSSQSGSLGGNAAESDLRNYYDRISLLQERVLRPAMERFIWFVSLADGFDPDTIHLKFKPLWMPSNLEQLQERKLQSEIDLGYINAGVVLPEEVTQSRFSKKEIDLDSMIIDEDHRAKQKAAEEEEAEKQAQEDRNRFEMQMQAKAPPPEVKKDSYFELVFEDE
jgi:uncharacterized protein